jgi:hypothetical protein
MPDIDARIAKRGFRVGDDQGRTVGPALSGLKCRKTKIFLPRRLALPTSLPPATIVLLGPRAAPRALRYRRCHALSPILPARERTDVDAGIGCDKVREAASVRAGASTSSFQPSRPLAAWLAALEGARLWGRQRALPAGLQFLRLSALSLGVGVVSGIVMVCSLAPTGASWRNALDPFKLTDAHDSDEGIALFSLGGECPRVTSP